MLQCGACSRGGKEEKRRDVNYISNARDVRGEVKGERSLSSFFFTPSSFLHHPSSFIIPPSILPPSSSPQSPFIIILPHSSFIIPFPSFSLLFPPVQQAMFMVEIDGVRVLYTGDYSREEDRHLMSAEVPSQRPEVLVVEST